MLLCNGDIEEAIRKFLGVLHHPGSFAHRWRDADHAVVLSRQITEPLSKHVLIFGWLGFGRGGGLGGFGRFQFVDRVIPDRISFCRCEALALHSTDMQELRSREFCHYIECADQLRQIVSVEGADIVPAKFLEHGARCDHPLHVLFGFLRQIPCAPNMPKDFFRTLA